MLVIALKILDCDSRLTDSYFLVRVKQHRAGRMEETADRACVQKSYSLGIVYIIPTQKYFSFWFSR